MSLTPTELERNEALALYKDASNKLLIARRALELTRCWFNVTRPTFDSGYDRIVMVILGWDVPGEIAKALKATE